ncbi:MAG: ATP-dependent DNA helicase RecG [Clostridia bacterium]|nr:ATP-dependent DNA helicase RecG [Clostridia bacterium]
MKQDIQYLKGVGEKRAQLLKKLGIDSVDALLRYYPRAYVDYKNTVDIFDANLGETVCIKATIVTTIEEKKVRPGMIVYRFVIADETGQMTVTLFNQKYLAGRLHMGSTYLFYGKVGGNDFYREMSSPEIKEENFAGIHPVYHACEGLSSAVIEKIVRSALSLTGPDPLPEFLREKYRLPELSSAISNIHFPTSEEALASARRRLMFEELFLLQTGLCLIKEKREKKACATIRSDHLDEFLSLLPFSPTGAQMRVIRECLFDMASGNRMNRLVQGDVGSGKTAVAAALMFASAKEGHQSAMMAPTEILAEQHFKTLSRLFGDKLQIELLTGSTTASKKKKIKERLAEGDIDIIVGTHALIEDDVQFRSPALFITDEQHRFGVEQRNKLSGKSGGVHTLVMSATPIPRTLGLIIYGDLDISIIDELPAGRTATETYKVKSSLHERVYNFIKKNIAEGRQAYIICPLVEEGETALISAEEYYKELSNSTFKGYSLGLLHGKMRPRDKDAVMKAFADGEIQLLIATTVVEVGVDVPNATVLVIENAERFGLSQLHQLRGRVGRGQHQSTCILISDAEGEIASERFKVICETTDGFKIAEADLEARGPGDFLGRRQHGLPELKIASLQTDMNALIVARDEAAALINADPTLEKYPALLETARDMFKKANTL